MSAAAVATEAAAQPAPAAPAAAPAPATPAPTPAPAAAPEAGKPAEAAKPTEAPAAAEAKPAEPVKIELKAPEGFAPEATAAIQAFAEQHKLTPEQAQALLDRDAQAHAGLAEQRQKVIDQWLADVKADPEIGGAAFAATSQKAQQAVARFGGDRFKGWLAETGLGNHPEFVRVFAAIGKAMGEDSFIQSGHPPASQKRTADILYGGG